MGKRVIISPLALAVACAVGGCSQAGTGLGAGADAPVYGGVETRLLDGDLVNFIVRIERPRSEKDAVAYAECAAAQYALIRGYGFARHVRTGVTESEGVYAADAVYLISAALPRGARTIDAEVVVASCLENRIPTV